MGKQNKEYNYLSKVSSGKECLFGGSGWIDFLWLKMAVFCGSTWGANILLILFHARVNEVKYYNFLL